MLETLSIERIPWPAYSPDLNPIENILYLLKRNVSRRENRPKTLHDLQQALQEEWTNLANNPDSWRPFLENMNDRIKLCIAKRGFATSY